MKQVRYLKISDIREMNKLKGSIGKVEVSGSLSMVTISIGDSTSFKSIVIETPETALYLQEGKPVNIIFKETEVILAKGNPDGISLINRIPAEVKDIKAGGILCEVNLATEAGPVSAILSRHAVDLLSLKKGDQVTAMVKLNEIMISE